MMSSLSPRPSGALGLLPVLALALSTSVPGLAAQDPPDEPEEEVQEEQEEREFPVIGGGEVRVGPAFPSVAEQGWSLGADLDLGALFFPGLRVFVGYLGLLGVDVDRDLRGNPLRGDLTAHGGRVGARLHVMRDQRFVPYLSAAALLYSTSTDAVDPEDAGPMEDIYGGNRFGWSLGLGVDFPLEPTEQMVALVELRRATVGPLRHWALDAGVRVELRELR